MAAKSIVRKKDERTEEQRTNQRAAKRAIGHLLIQMLRINGEVSIQLSSSRFVQWLRGFNPEANWMVAEPHTDAFVISASRVEMLVAMQLVVVELEGVPLNDGQSVIESDQDWHREGLLDDTLHEAVDRPEERIIFLFALLEAAWQGRLFEGTGLHKRVTPLLEGWYQGCYSHVLLS